MKLQLRNALLAIVSTLALMACQTVSKDPSTTKQINTLSIEMPTLTISLDSDGDGVPDELDHCPNTGLQYVVDERGCPTTMGPDMSLKMEYRAFFSRGSSELLSRYYEGLDRVAMKMREHETATMRIEGHISENESDSNSAIEASNTLAKDRAMGIKNYLIIKHQIAPERIVTYDCNINTQIAPNDTQEGRSMNRRIYAVVTKPEEQKSHYDEDKSNLDRCIGF